MRTVELSAIEYAQSIDDNDYTIETESAFIAGVKFAQRWIPIEEELPPIGIPVVCKYEVFNKEYYWAGTFYTEERMVHFVKKHLMITHWRLIELK